MGKTFIIAEAGPNHNGSVSMAERLIDAAVDAGVDAVKFQTFRTENVVTRTAPKADYQRRTTGAEDSQFDMLKRVELTQREFELLYSYSHSRNLKFLSTPFDMESVDFLVGLGVEIIKIPSGEITNLPYLRKIGGLKKEIILSTGMAYMKEIEDAMYVLADAGTPPSKVTVLHCNTEYPTPMDDVNLAAMHTISKKLGVIVGYSDHTSGIEVPIAAVALGAVVIEKHFTLDRSLPGPDHKASLEPGELKEMVRAIRNIERAIGSGVKEPSPSELKNRLVARRSIVAAKPILKGEPFTEANLTAKRPGTGISPLRWDEMVGEIAARDYATDELISE